MMFAIEQLEAAAAQAGAPDDNAVVLTRAATEVIARELRAGRAAAAQLAAERRIGAVTAAIGVGIGG